MLTKPIQSVRRFLRDERGTGTVVMLGMLPMFLAFSGFSILGASAYDTRAELQTAADAAAIAGAFNLPQGFNVAQNAAINYAQLNLPTTVAGTVLVTNDFTTGNWNSGAHTFTTPAVNGTPINAVRVILRRAASNSNPLSTTWLGLIGISSVNVVAQSIVATAGSKLRVALVLDNTGSMCEPDSNPCPGDSNPKIKINALKTAATNLLNTLKGAAANPGDVQVSIVPFAKDVNVGTSNVNASWIDWTDWNAAPANSTPSFSTGPGNSCPWTTNSNGFQCVQSPGSSSATGTIPSNGTYKGYICPSMDNGYVDSGRTGHYYNGCYNSVAATQTAINTVSTGRYASCSGYNNCSCSGTGTSKVCKQTVTTNGYNHSWIVNARSTWAGCIMDRTQDYDTTNTVPTNTATDFPAENSDYCPSATVMPLGYNWTNLNSKIGSMSANGNTNQTVGLDHGWMTLMSSFPYSAPTLPPNTGQYIILLSDGLNTQNRWTTTQSSIDAREKLACSTAKAAGIAIYTVFVDLNGTQGNSAVLQSCSSTPSSKYYFDLTQPNQIITTFNLIGNQIAKLHVVE